MSRVHIVLCQVDVYFFSSLGYIELMSNMPKLQVYYTKVEEVKTHIVQRHHHALMTYIH